MTAFKFMIGAIIFLLVVEISLILVSSAKNDRMREEVQAKFDHAISLCEVLNATDAGVLDDGNDIYFVLKCKARL